MKNQSPLGAVPFRWHEYKRDWVQVEDEVIEETLVTIYVNGMNIATFMGSPLNQDDLGLGFLKNESIITGLDEIEILHLSEDGCCVDIWLDHDVEKPENVIITSGCGGGITFDDPRVGIDPIQDDSQIKPEVIRAAFNRLQSPDSLYARARGVHTAGLLDPESESLLVMSEDIGRHNTVDKITGACLKERIETQGRVLLVTGRISSEMLRKAAMMGCPITASRNSPTSMSVEMARAWNITLIGYVRRGRMRIYSHPERLGYREPVEVPIAGD